MSCRHPSEDVKQPFTHVGLKLSKDVYTKLKPEHVVLLIRKINRMKKFELLQRSRKRDGTSQDTGMKQRVRERSVVSQTTTAVKNQREQCFKNEEVITCIRPIKRLHCGI